ncbi:MAG: imidazole glycerol phosphate synthase subunit HisH [candidate division KSB1 bacterium]|nr:imidazole glycerol phosphate synthase subunit HisH [candidate division KSB1 bacterium]MDZ7274401.1 imidazole glycerol phosphate synthase subunit HisH [candidate division KSB1 bacterium]MDZ7284937.1 imidazole glycerol phosphate synthase subunit HisH [candidate division KSB1 bacterium]MDZ7297642.1 imidazole glycerol phosphate synthase subunit HisH [candidate division KSB1 bacterium]MDZ7348509.1 imidazole glycerol phosphate synthase subunit HisH [candidate division KSB1 bacterium]
MADIGIIDYGMGNLHSVQKALQAVGAQAELVTGAGRLTEFRKLILPGVGAFGDAMNNLTARGLLPGIHAVLAAGTPLLGICLGMQLLFSESEEMGQHAGLNVLPGVVRRLRVTAKVPHMGWNQIKQRMACPLFENVADGAFVYFANSYAVHPAQPAVIAGETEYETTFASVIWHNNVYGVQFHPEKSQHVGLQMLKNFVSL